LLLQKILAIRSPVLHNSDRILGFLPYSDYNIDTMWQTILEKIKASILAYWSQVTWFVLGCVLGVVVLGGLVSCVSFDVKAQETVQECDDCVEDVKANPTRRPGKPGQQAPKSR